MNRLSQPYLERRKSTLAAIHDRSQAEVRKAHVRATLLRLIGGLPDDHDPLNATLIGVIPQDGFSIERIIYDSLPGYHVTANLYLPSAGKGPFPVVVYHSGHGPSGKSEAFGLASNLARNGIAVFAYDPLGAGERLQAMNPATGKSWAGPDEHSQAQIPISLVGDHVSRYMVWDAMRGVDYLTTRHDIDATNIGSYGCSGGGTLSAYLTALDTRVKAGAVACYLTSYEELLKTIGPQDGEQVIPDFIKEGLDFPDLVELAAPRAYAMVSTTEDMFPFAGARATHDEAERFYSLYGAKDNLKWFTGPGGHGAIRPLMPQIIAFYKHWLAHDDSPVLEMPALPRPAVTDLQCTTTGQVTTAMTGRTIYQINQDRAHSILPPKAAISSLEGRRKLLLRLEREIPAVIGMSRASQALPMLTVVKTEQRQGYRLESAIFHSRSGMELPAVLALPDKQGSKSALLITSSQPGVAEADGDLDRAARGGKLVLAITPLPWPQSTDAVRPTMGTMLPWTSRAFLIGRTFVGMRTEDTLAAVRWLAAQHEVNPGEIDAYGYGASGVVLLHAAVLEPRIRKVTIEHSLVSYRSVVSAAVHRDVAESVVPGVLLHYDLDDLMIAAGPRTITVINPVDGEGNLLTEDAFREQLADVYASNRSFGGPSRIEFIRTQTGNRNGGQ
ncbi:acetylxylan esterase [Granulicella sp. WH15]|uniref:alpha/beta hydrolase family protein n=1 Tax=Granulicella sp. WH15 TaxID=2602070 RepID=UPI0013A5B910|nr:acetylxylan esterase [Granulicella sp. WH15]